MDRRSAALLPEGPPEAFARGKRPRQDSEPGRRIEGVAGRVVIIDDDEPSAQEIAVLLVQQGHDVDVHASFADGIAHARKRPPDVIVADPYSNQGPGDAFADAVRRLTVNPQEAPELVLLTRFSSVESAVSALHAGAADYVVKPASLDRVLLAVERAFQRRRLLHENVRLKHDLALFAAAQRVLESWDPSELVSFGLHSLFTFSAADAGVIVSQGQLSDSRNITDADAAILTALPLRTSSSRQLASTLDPALAHLGEALVLELGDSRAALLFCRAGFSPLSEESALFLSYELTTAFKNSARYATAAQAALRDSLTGLWNATSFQQALEQLITRSLPTGHTSSVAFLDVDRFKLVNDTHGHVIGSQLLAELGQLLVHLLREGDVVARYGGDEFTVLLPEVDAQTAYRVCERVRQSIANHVFCGTAAVAVTVCIGVATFPTHAQNPTALLDSADRAMYTGKGASRNVVQVAGHRSP